MALASIQGLYRELKATRGELQQKDERIQSLEDRLQVLEKLLLSK